MSGPLFKGDDGQVYVYHAELVPRGQRVPDLDLFPSPKPRKPVETNFVRFCRWRAKASRMQARACLLEARANRYDDTIPVVSRETKERGLLSQVRGWREIAREWMRMARGEP